MKALVRTEALTWVGNDDGGCVVLDLLSVALGEVRLLLQLLELGVVLRPLCPAQLLLSELKQTFKHQDPDWSDWSDN